MVYQTNIKLRSNEIGLSRDYFTQLLLKRILRARLSWGMPLHHSLTRPLEDLINDFSENIAKGAKADLQEYIRRRSMSGRTLGGRAGTSAALIYNQASLKLSENSIGAIGEGIAGDYLENFEGLAFEVRPFEVSPDFIFKDSVGARILVEVKASNDRFRPLVPVAVDLIDILAKSKLIRRGKYYAYAIAVKIVDASNFELERLRIEEIP